MSNVVRLCPYSNIQMSKEVKCVTTYQSPTNSKREPVYLSSCFSVSPCNKILHYSPTTSSNVCRSVLFSSTFQLVDFQVGHCSRISTCTCKNWSTTFWPGIGKIQFDRSVSTIFLGQVDKFSSRRVDSLQPSCHIHCCSHKRGYFRTFIDFPRNIKRTGGRRNYFSPNDQHLVPVFMSLASCCR